MTGSARGQGRYFLALCLACVLVRITRGVNVRPSGGGEGVGGPGRHLPAGAR